MIWHTVDPMPNVGFAEPRRQIHTHTLGIWLEAGGNKLFQLGAVLFGEFPVLSPASFTRELYPNLAIGPGLEFEELGHVLLVHGDRHGAGALLLQADVADAVQVLCQEGVELGTTTIETGDLHARAECGIRVKSGGDVGSGQQSGIGLGTGRGGKEWPLGRDEHLSNTWGWTNPP